MWDLTTEWRVGILKAGRQGSRRKSDMDWVHGGSNGQRLRLSLNPSEMRKAIVLKVAPTAAVPESAKEGTEELVWVDM